MSVTAIIPAAGQGTRLGSKVPKQFLHIEGKSILSHTLEAFARSGAVESVLLVVPEKECAATRNEWLKKNGIVEQVVVGGEKRQDSVYNGFQALGPGTEIVVVHDGVRPFVSESMIRESIEAAREYGAAVTAVPVSDTLKRVTPEGLVDHTVDRDGLWRIQTPQAFQYGVLKEAFRKAWEESYYGTDEGALVEFIGKQIKIVQGLELNIKVTRPEDLILGESIYRRLQAAS